MALRRPSICGEAIIGADYSEEELRLLKAVDAYKREHGVKFPTIRDMLLIFKSLGYATPDNKANTLDAG